MTINRPIKHHLKMGKKEPLISVIIPTYNRATLVKRALASALDQSYQNTEIIIIDDGSTDKTSDTIKNFEDTRIKYYYCKKNSGGPTKPKNLGVKRSKGKYIAFLDSDDYWLPQKLALQLSLFEKSKDPKLAIVGSTALIDRGIGIKKQYRYDEIRKDFYQRILAGNFVLSCSSLLIKKNLFKEVGFFNESLKVGEDWDFLIRVFQKGYSFQALKQPSFIYKRHGANITKYSLKNNKLAIMNAINVITNYQTDILKGNNAIAMRRIGVYYAILGDLKKAKLWLKRGLDVNKTDVRGRVIYFLTFFGQSGSLLINLLSTVWKYFYFGKYN